MHPNTLVPPFRPRHGQDSALLLIFLRYQRGAGIQAATALLSRGESILDFGFSILDWLGGDFFTAQQGFNGLTTLPRTVEQLLRRCPIG
jgi:hypothetical protein